jgi:hypothetical protein
MKHLYLGYIHASRRSRFKCPMPTSQMKPSIVSSSPKYVPQHPTKFSLKIGKVCCYPTTSPELTVKRRHIFHAWEIFRGDLMRVRIPPIYDAAITANVEEKAV